MVRESLAARGTAGVGTTSGAAGWIPLALGGADAAGLLFPFSWTDCNEFCRTLDVVGRDVLLGVGDARAAAFGSGSGGMTGDDVAEGGLVTPFLVKLYVSNQRSMSFRPVLE
jgi:hypothetical protein